MKGVAFLPVAAILATALAACGASHRMPRSAAVVAASPQRSSVASTSASPAPTTTTDQHLFANGMAASIPAIPDQAVSGPVMRAYIEFEHSYGAASGAVGRPDPSGSVTQIAGGFNLCWPDPGNGPVCDRFTQAITNQAGQITGLSVDGKPVAGRIATAPAAASGGLTISGVAAYELTDVQNTVVVAFRLTDSSYWPMNTSPALLASLSGASDDMNKDALPATLAPGDTLYAAAGFDVTRTTGLFCLQPNDGFGEHLPCTMLSRV